MFFLESPERAKARMERRANRAIHPDCIQNFDDLKRPRKCVDIGIRASTFKPHDPMSLLPRFKKAEPDVPIVDVTGTIRYVKQTLFRGTGLVIAAAKDLYSENGLAFFDTNIEVPTLQIRDGLEGPWKTWMSLTPWEMWTCRPGVQAATGHVVLAGLGMGWMLSEIVKKPTVKSVTVVEKNESLMTWYGDELCRNTEKVVKVIRGCIYEEAKRFDFKEYKFILDIWEGYGDAESDRRLAEMRARNARVWAWGGSGRSDIETRLTHEARAFLGL